MKKRNEETVGFFVLVGLLLLSVIIFLISGEFLLRPGYHVNVRYDYVSILDKGAPIRMAGVRVGEVSGVQLIFDPEKKKVRVNVEIFIDAKAQIFENYLFKIQGTHVLSEPHIEITPLSGEAPAIVDGKIIEGVPLEPIEAMIEKVSKIAEDVSGLVSENGTLQTTLRNVGSATESLDNILNTIEAGDGTVGKLFTKDELYQEIRGFVADIKARPWRLLKKDDGKKFLFF